LIFEVGRLGSWEGSLNGISDDRFHKSDDSKGRKEKEGTPIMTQEVRLEVVNERC